MAGQNDLGVRASVGPQKGKIGKTVVSLLIVFGNISLVVPAQDLVSEFADAGMYL
jgi:hypothetical protein